MCGTTWADPAGMGGRGSAGSPDMTEIMVIGTLSLNSINQLLSYLHLNESHADYLMY